ncbi:conjugative transposon protein TraJ [Niabella hibiscisoli]|uniref:conjugative transposon protein TraJ n=1 Tax=Niabella hibiscisoli TaxID=1825928 RepID=UPI001F0D4669|nr:conjugative transposon protein TraJ [Niabella hibiscisoli]MCH5717804.1 conjugative transposon protein TraJ [Niabella hibiscisoli]
MKKKIQWMVVLLLIVLPSTLYAQGRAEEIAGLQSILEQLYDEMIPLAGDIVKIGQSLAGFGAMLYIGYRVWGHIARAEAIDFYPLLRPFALGLVLASYMQVISLFNSILNPTVSVTAAMVKDSDAAIKKLLKDKEEAIKQSKEWLIYQGANGEGDREAWYKYTHPNSTKDEGFFEEIGNDIRFSMSKYYYQFKNSVSQWMSEILQVLFQAAALCINTLRTFHLVILVILGPIVIGLSVYDGFQHSLTQWIARYINIYLWLPIANIFGALIGKVQQGMIKLDTSQVNNTGDTFFSPTDTGYLAFLIIGIIGYFTVPSVANYVIHAHGGNGLLSRVNRVSGMLTSKR